MTKETISENKKKSLGKSFWIGVVVLVVGFIMYVWYIIQSSPIFSIWSRDKEEFKMKKEICKETVLEQLKSPWTAKFWKEWKNGMLVVKNYVDSQNSYWALIRSYFICKFNYDNKAKLDGSIEVLRKDSEDSVNRELYEALDSGILNMIWD